MASAAKAAKAALRRRVRTEVARLSPEERLRQSRAVTSRLLQLPQFQSSARVSVYLHMDDEVQTLDIVRHLINAGKQCFIPRYDSTSSHMDMVRLHSMSDYDALPLTKWNIKQPGLDESREEAIASGGLDLVLVPGLAFTRSGDRLGRGRGYYDRFLSRCRAAQSTGPITIALAFQQQVVDEVPVEETDVPVDLVLCEESFQ